LERPPSDIDDPHLWTLTEDTACYLNDKKSLAEYDEHLYISCHAFFDSCANATSTGEGMDAPAFGPHSSTEHTTTVAIIQAGHRTHASTGEPARTRLLVEMLRPTSRYVAAYALEFLSVGCGFEDDFGVSGA
jgi:hypothetical protein